jgi:hypothetical protein
MKARSGRKGGQCGGILLPMVRPNFISSGRFTSKGSALAPGAVEHAISGGLLWLGGGSLAVSTDENGNLAAEFVHPENGTLICIERAKSKDAKYPRYTLRPGRQPAPVEALIAGQQHDAHAATAKLTLDVVLAAQGGSDRGDIAGGGISVQ